MGSTCSRVVLAMNWMVRKGLIDKQAREGWWIVERVRGRDAIVVINYCIEDLNEGSIFYHREGIVTTCVKQLDAWLMAFVGVRAYNITVTRERLYHNHSRSYHIIKVREIKKIYCEIY